MEKADVQCEEVLTLMALCGNFAYHVFVKKGLLGINPDPWYRYW